MKKLMMFMLMLSMFVVSTPVKQANAAVVTVPTVTTITLRVAWPHISRWVAKESTQKTLSVIIGTIPFVPKTAWSSVKTVTKNGWTNTKNTTKRIAYGPNKKGGGHDHRYNTGKDRTPAQKAADLAKRN